VKTGTRKAHVGAGSGNFLKVEARAESNSFGSATMLVPYNGSSLKKTNTVNRFNIIELAGFPP
jgi:hypothetical protein